MRVKLQLYATIVGVVGILLGVACKMWFPHYWFDWYPAIIGLYWLMEMVMSFVVERHQDKMDSASVDGKKWFRVYMIAKMVKLVVTLAFIVLYLTLDPENDVRRTVDAKVEFAVCAMAYYLVNLGIETAVVTRRNGSK